MQYSQEDYVEHYIVQALFKLMGQYEYEKISVTDIANKAGVGRATFYRHFKTKEDVIVYYFNHIKTEYNSAMKYFPRCKEDYVDISTSIFALFKENVDIFKLLKRAHLEYLYLDYLNKNFKTLFENTVPDANEYSPLIYSGMLFNVSMKWLDEDCATPAKDVAQTMINAIYF